MNLREQHTSVSSRAADRPATEADTHFGEVSFESRDTAEQAVLGKEARVVEEVVAEQKFSDRTETVKDSVRRTDVDVEKMDDEKTTISGNHGLRRDGVRCTPSRFVATLSGPFSALESWRPVLRGLAISQCAKTHRRFSRRRPS